MLSPESNKTVCFKIEEDSFGNGSWMTYKYIDVQPGKTFNLEFPKAFQSRWIRFVATADCKATAWLVYQ